jgi:hypothetical protein
VVGSCVDGNRPSVEIKLADFLCYLLAGCSTRSLLGGVIHRIFTYCLHGFTATCSYAGAPKSG